MDWLSLSEVTDDFVSKVTWKDVIFVLVTALATRWIYWNLISPFLSPLRKVPGRPYRPIVGNMFEALNAEPMSTAIRWMKELDSLTVRFYYFFGQERLVTADPKFFRHCLVTNVNNYHRVRPRRISLMNKALFFLSGSPHHMVRKLLNPAFGIQMLEGFIPVFEKKARCVADMWKDMFIHTTESIQIPIQSFMTRIALDSICETGFNFSPNSILDPESSGVEKLTSYLTTIGRGSVIEGVMPFYNKLPTQRNKLQWARESYIKSIIHKAIGEKRKTYQGQIDNIGKHPPRDLLSLLVLASDKEGNQIPDDLMFENVCGFLFAGFDTTGTSLTWIMMQLATYPEVQQKVREEVLRVIPDPNTPITHTLLDQLQYMTCVIKETQRLFPVVSSTSRVSVEDDKIGDMSIPAGTVIALHIAALHRSEENWTNPEEFIPERFNEEVPPYMHLPFYTGPYMCIGHKFAMFEIKTVLACLLRHFEFSLVPDFKIRRVQDLVVKPKPPLQLMMRKI